MTLLSVLSKLLFGHKVLVFKKNVFLCPQEQPGFYAHEAVTDEGEQVHPGPEQLPF